MTTAALPLLRLDDESPEQTIDFVHIDSIAARSVVHNWMILAHRHRNLFQILLIERGGGEMTFETTAISFAAPCAILVPATVAHGFRLRRAVTDGWVITFSENIAAGIGKEGETLAPLKALAASGQADRKSTRLNSSHRCISYAVFCLKKKKQSKRQHWEDFYWPLELI